MQRADHHEGSRADEVHDVRDGEPLVVPDAICTVAGATGVSSIGKAMVCRTTPTDIQLRWHVAV